MVLCNPHPWQIKPSLTKQKLSMYVVLVENKSSKKRNDWMVTAQE